MHKTLIRKSILTLSRGGWLRGVRSLAWRLGVPLVAKQLAVGTDESVAAHYEARVTDCDFLDDHEHYERPRLEWVVAQVRQGRLLEIGCGNGGMTKRLAPLVGEVTAMDVSKLSLQALEARSLRNVRIAHGLIENFCPPHRYDWIVLSEVIEHLRHPDAVLARCIEWLAPGGCLLITTPNGRWESDEHLHEFTMPSFVGLLGRLDPEMVEACYVRDRSGVRRWLAGKVVT